MASHNIAPSDPVTHYQLILLRSKITSTQPSLPPKILEIFESELASLAAKDSDLGKLNDDYLQEHHESAPHVQAAIRARANIIDPISKDKCFQDMIRTLALDCNLEHATNGLNTLRDWHSEKRYIDDYKAAAHERYPEASVFVPENAS